jgi:hypothetical protein
LSSFQFNLICLYTILGHPNVRAMVSHCGRNSLNEAADVGVPLVAIPLFSDQLYNAALAKHKGIGVYVDVRKLNELSTGENVMIGALENVCGREESWGLSLILSLQFAGAESQKLPAECPITWCQNAGKPAASAA